MGVLPYWIQRTTVTKLGAACLCINTLCSIVYRNEYKFVSLSSHSKHFCNTWYTMTKPSCREMWAYTFRIQIWCYDASWAASGVTFWLIYGRTVANISCTEKQAYKDFVNMWCCSFLEHKLPTQLPGGKYFLHYENHTFSHLLVELNRADEILPSQDMSMSDYWCFHTTQPVHARVLCLGPLRVWVTVHWKV